MNRYRAFFFDADDTLFDYPVAERAALTAVLNRFRIPLPIETVIPAYRRHNLILWSEFEQGRITQDSLRTERFRRLLTEFGIESVPIHDIGDSYLEALSDNSQLLDGALELITGLAARLPLVLVTNGIGRVQRRRFHRSPITRYFRTVIISEEAGFAKPDPRILEPALNELNIAASEALLIGDSVSSDMACARNAGMDFCWYNPGGMPSPADYAPRFIVQELAEIAMLTNPLNSR
jgi:2-haloacid dehalogenase